MPIRHRWPWLRFNLKFVFVVTLATALAAGWLRHRELARQALIGEVEAAGGKVAVAPAGWLPSPPGARVTVVTLPHEQTAEFDLERLRQFPKLEAIDLTHVRFRADGMHLEMAAWYVQVDRFEGTFNGLRWQEVR